MDRQGEHTYWVLGPYMWPLEVKGYDLSFSEGGNTDSDKGFHSNAQLVGALFSRCGRLPLTPTYPNVSWGPLIHGPDLSHLGKDLTHSTEMVGSVSVCPSRL